MSVYFGYKKIDPKTLMRFSVLLVENGILFFFFFGFFFFSLDLGWLGKVCFAEGANGNVQPLNLTLH